MLWARTDQPVVLRVPALAPDALLVDQEGNSRALPADGGYYDLTLPAARCVDAQAGCFIGGPTYLLVEEATAGDLVAPVTVDTIVPAPDPLMTVTVPGPAATATAEPATVQPSPTPTRTRTPFPTRGPASPPASGPTELAPSPTPRPAAAARVMLTVSPLPAATPAIEADPIESISGQERSGELSPGQWSGLLALAVAVVLAGLAVRRARTR